MKRWRDRGFSLLEVLVAIAILGVMIGGLLAIIDQENYLVKNSANLLDARLTANETMETLKTQPFKELESYSFVEMAKTGKMTVDVTIKDFGSETLKNIVVTVAWVDAKNRERNITLSTLRAQYPLGEN